MNGSGCREEFVTWRQTSVEFEIGGGSPASRTSCKGEFWRDRVTCHQGLEQRDSAQATGCGGFERFLPPGSFRPRLHPLIYIIVCLTLHLPTPRPCSAKFAPDWVEQLQLRRACLQYNWPVQIGKPPTIAS
jgi:hypothetical protein